MQSYRLYHLLHCHVMFDVLAIVVLDSLYFERCGHFLVASSTPHVTPHSGGWVSGHCRHVADSLLAFWLSLSVSLISQRSSKTCKPGRVLMAHFVYTHGYNSIIQTTRPLSLCPLLCCSLVQSLLAHIFSWAIGGAQYFSNSFTTIWSFTTNPWSDILQYLFYSALVGSVRKPLAGHNTSVLVSQPLRRSSDWELHLTSFLGLCPFGHLLRRCTYLLIHIHSFTTFLSLVMGIFTNWLSFLIRARDEPFLLVHVPALIYLLLFLSVTSGSSLIFLFFFIPFFCASCHSIQAGTNIQSESRVAYPTIAIHLFIWSCGTSSAISLLLMVFSLLPHTWRAILRRSAILILETFSTPMCPSWSIGSGFVNERSGPNSLYHCT